MTIQLSTRVRNARGDVLEDQLGATKTIELRTGAQPATNAAASTGTLIVSIVLPADALADSAAGVVELAGDWPETDSIAAGTIGYFRIISGGITDIQGSVTVIGGGGDIELQTVAILVSGQAIDITGLTLTEGNA